MGAGGVTMARLDRLYVTRHHLPLLRSSCIAPSSLSDHDLAFSELSLPGRACAWAPYWCFNVSLLQDSYFRDCFAYFWRRWEAARLSHSSWKLWWDVGKVQIRAFCQQYTQLAASETRRRIRELEEDVAELEAALLAAGSDTALSESLRFRRKCLRDLAESAARGARIRARCQELAETDAPTRFFFNLERRRAASKVLDPLKTPEGLVITEPGEIREHAVAFYRGLFAAEPSCPEATRELHEGLPRLDALEAGELERDLSLEELAAATAGLASGKAPGLDGLPAEFYKTFWPLLGPSLLRVFQESLADKVLPISCRRAVLTLLPKKGDLGYMKNWRPVSLLCADYKILAKALATRLRAVMASLTGPEQSYCVPGRTIQDNLFLLWDLLMASELFGLDIGLISLDQEKAFDRVGHAYLFQTLEAFGFGPLFTGALRVLYRDISSLLKVNGVLCAPFPARRGIRQGCPLSGMLYSLAIEPLLHTLRRRLSGVALPVATGPSARPRLRLSAYADDVTVFLNTQEDVRALADCQRAYERASSARINWAKSDTLLLGAWTGTPPPDLPGGLTWRREGLKFLGVFLGPPTFMARNWDDLEEGVEARLQRWRWHLPSLSYRGRVLVINNLAAATFWHRCAVLDPPPDLLERLQRNLVDFFWDGRHWLPRGVLHLPVAEGGQGLVDLASRVAAFRLQALQRLLYSEEQLPWQQLACRFLQRVGALGFDRELFLLTPTLLNWAVLLAFYRSVVRAWQAAFRLQPRARTLCFPQLLREPLVHNSALWGSVPSLASASLTATLIQARVLRLHHLLDPAWSAWLSPEALAAWLGVRSIRTMGHLLRDIRTALPPVAAAALDEHLRARQIPRAADAASKAFPSLPVTPAVAAELAGGPGTLLRLPMPPDSDTGCPFASLSRRSLYAWVVCVRHAQVLAGRPDTPWRRRLGPPASPPAHPAWRTLYKPPTAKKTGDLQWRLLHGILATGTFASHFDPAASTACPFCPGGVEEDLFHAFLDCPRLRPLFATLELPLRALGRSLSETTYICSYPYRAAEQGAICLANFLLGQAKMAVLKSRRNRLAGTGSDDAPRLFGLLVRARLSLEFEHAVLRRGVPAFEAL
ncbi:transposon TX1 uncharacterized 149 kDa protein isoform X1 [Alligator mississippiensis]|uniref:transposon TX1 uncharacterized 149 kDa protein isoform X1 n=1 Tax=Alligator mississippiensis TaxID=8496 RepID=UPI0028781322|nr:transposon TX1 uncharacterized 149 kDa protein isoform X1 [Alligator mississippiensis]